MRDGGRVHHHQPECDPGRISEAKALKKEELIRRLELGGVKNRVVAISENFSLLVDRKSVV